VLQNLSTLDRDWTNLVTLTTPDTEVPKEGPSRVRRWLCSAWLLADLVGVVAARR